MVCALLVLVCNSYAQEATSWVDFCEKRSNSDLQNSILLDYSYAGYHHSEKALPDTSSWNTISVTDYGATINDETFDDAGIQAAINAAEATNIPTVVYFPSGRYKISSETTFDTPIKVSKSFIVLKGAGIGIGGTEIYAEKMGDATKKWNTSWNLQFIPTNRAGENLSNITDRINRGDTKIVVENISAMSVGMPIVISQQTGVENIALNIPELTIKPEWTQINETGMRITEKHTITAIDGNVITLKRPVNAIVTADLSRATVQRYRTIEEVGVEDILFTSGWKEHPENFKHHANDIVDYAWRALRFDNVRNGWVRNVEFRDWNEALSINHSMAVTVEDIKFSGKQGHVSSQIGWSTDVLVQNCEDLVTKQTQFRGGQWHGPGIQVRSTGCVYLNFKMQHHQFVDFHGQQPYGNLLDNIQGGILDRNGGALNSQPHSGPDLCFWNFEQKSDYVNKTYDFWVLSRNTQSYFVHPKFVGFTAPNANISFKNVGLNELQGKQAYPISLFDAQLQLRLFNVYASASSEKEGALAKHVINNNNSDYWSPRGNAVGSYLMLDFGKEEFINSILLKEISNSIKKFNLQCWINGAWVDFKTTPSNQDNTIWNIDTAVETRKIRITIEDVSPDSEIQVTQFTAVKSDQVPPINFTIVTTGETCAGKDNGKIQITASQTKAFVLNFNGKDYSFTDNLNLEDVNPGTYNMCISVAAEDYEQCYEVTIQSGTNIAGKIEVSKQIAQIQLTNGTPPYKILKNGVFVLETFLKDFEVDIDYGDTIEVSSSKACEGLISKRIEILDLVKAYPNPSNGNFEISVPNSSGVVAVEIYNVHTQLLTRKNYNVISGKIAIDINAYPKGIYVVKLDLDKPTRIKIIKN